MRNRIRAIAILVAIVALTVAVAGCGKKDSGTAYTAVTDLTKLPAGMQTSVTLASYAKGYIWLEDETGGYLCVSFGNDSLTTPEISSVVLDGKTLRVSVGEKPVAGGALSSTSKLIVIRVDGAKNVTPSVTDAKGTVTFTQLIPSAGAYNGQIDTTSIELNTQGGAVAFQLDARALPFFDSTSPLYRNFQSKDQVRFCYFRNAQGQNVITYIEKSK